MFNSLSMFGIKIRPHRSLLIFIVILCFVIVFLFKSEKKKSSIEKMEMVSDEDINLIDLFNLLFRLTYEAGESIQLFKNTKRNFGEIFQKKKSFPNLKSEPVTLADLLSHSIITEGLKKKYPQLKIVSEEKDPIYSKQFQLIKEQFHQEEQSLKIPFIYDEKNFLTVPLSSVAVWIDPLDATKEFTENLLQYVTVMSCVTVEKKATIGIIYAPFTKKLTWAWLGVHRSTIKRDENVLLEPHKATIDEIIVSRSHAGRIHQILRDLYRDKQYQILPAAGSAYKTIQVLEGYADYYLHITPIKKWDLCAPDVILRANDGTMTTLTNQTINYDDQNNQFLITDGILATYQRNHVELLKFLTSSNLTNYLHQKKHS